MKTNGRFRCIRCGDRFDLTDPDEIEMFENGHYDQDPDICDECLDGYNNAICENYSEADPGL